MVNFVMVANAATPLKSDDLSKTFARPLIIGASVSAGRNAVSPGARLAQDLNPQTQIETLAIGGRPSGEILKLMRKDTLKDRSVVVALDLFFWDSILNSSESSVKAMMNLVNEAKALDVPIVIGEVPDLLPGFQKQAATLNKSLHNLCDAYSKCFAMPFESLLKKILAQGYVEIKGQKRRLPEIVPDGLHLSALGSDYLADVLKKVLLGTFN